MATSIVTVTPSPALDRTLRVDRLAFGGIARVQEIREDPGGKGAKGTRREAEPALGSTASDTNARLKSQPGVDDLSGLVWNSA